MKKFLLQLSTSQQEMITFQFETRSEAMFFHQSLFALFNDCEISNVRCYLTELVDTLAAKSDEEASGEA